VVEGAGLALYLTKADYDESEHPRDEIGRWTDGGTFYHATSSEKAAHAILASGEIHPGATAQGRTKQAPVAGHAYLTQSRDYAQTYALGGVYAGCFWERERRGGGWGVSDKGLLGRLRSGAAFLAILRAFPR
jgi:hypothetical protein